MIVESSCNTAEIISLDLDKMESSILEIVKNLKEGEERQLFCKDDFSNVLIKIINENFAHLPLKAKLLNHDENGVLIKIKYPKEGEGCCGCCS
jgi:hypothetical protein